MEVFPAPIFLSRYLCCEERIDTCFFLSVHYFSIYRDLSSRYMFLRVIKFFLQMRYSFMPFDFWWRRVVMSKGSHHLIPMMSAKFVTVFSFIFIFLSIICIMRVTRQRQSWYTLTVLEDCTLIMWRCRALEFYFDLDLIRSLSISSYALITSGGGGHFW